MFNSLLNSYILSIILLKYIMTLMLIMNLILIYFYINKMMTIMIMLNSVFKFSKMSFYFIFDLYSLIFIMIVMTISFLVFSFINMYMYKDINLMMFLFMTFLFIFSMLLLISSGNFWMIILGWEGLGISSYYLIFFYNNYDAWISSLKTFFNNKIGDFFLILSMMIIIIEEKMSKMIIFLFIFSLLTKTAQFPFMAWLPMAMAAPTPISSLVHSSTLVTAGIFVFMRYSFFLKSLLMQNIFTNLCLISMLFSSLKAINEVDMKKMIALSTLSQMSLIMFLNLLNFKMMSFIYLCNHALFKSLMFVNMGMMMLKNFSNQLENNMNIYNSMNLYYISFKISCLNLMNMPFFSSFFLKEKIIFFLYSFQMSLMKFFLFIFNSFLTMNYSLKFLMFFDNKLGNMNYNMKYNYMLNLIFFLTIFSLIFSKLMMNMMFIKSKNFLILMMYLISLSLNMSFKKGKMKMINNLGFLNILFYSAPFFFFLKNYKMKEIEMWLEFLYMNSLKTLSNNNLFNLSYFMNLKLIFLLFFFLVLMF